jgi:hypothetical protein
MVVLAIGLKTRSTLRFRARMTPIRANIVGPPLSANVFDRELGVESGIELSNDRAPQSGSPCA